MSIDQHSHFNLKPKFKPILSHKHHFSHGLLGALLFCLIGTTIWLYVGHLGIMFFMSGYLTCLLSMIGYKLFGGSNHKAEIFLTGLIVLMIVLISTILCYILANFSTNNPAKYTLLEYFYHFPETLKNPSSRYLFLIHIGINYFFTLVCPYSSSQDDNDD